MRRLAVLVFGALLLAGCQLVRRDPAPEGFTATACEAYRILLVAANMQSADDLDATIAEADVWLDGIPTWDPGAAFVVQLHIIRNLLGQDAAAPDPVPWLKLLREGPRLPDAAATYEVLVADHGLSCPSPGPS